MERFILTLKPLTAIHIGTGSEISPLEYTVIETKGEHPCKLLRFSPEKLVGLLGDDKRKILMDTIDSNDYLQLRNFFRKNITRDAVQYEIPITSEYAGKYTGKVQTVNRLSLFEMYRSPKTYKPIVPGSSIKGAIRTAILNETAKLKEKPNYHRMNDRELQQKILGYTDEKNDPFRCLLIRDCIIRGKNNQIAAAARLYHKQRTGEFDFESIQLYLEMIRGTLMDGDAFGATGVLINNKLADLNMHLHNWTFIREKIDVNRIITSCNSFYKDAFNEEYRKFYLSSDRNELKQVGEALNKEIEKITEADRCLVRIGRYSQAECVTVEEYRKLPKGSGKSRTLVSFKNIYFPLGWAVLQIKPATKKAENTPISSENYYELQTDKGKSHA
jgi:CRISPR-associated protein Csm5